MRTRAIVSSSSPRSPVLVVDLLEVDLGVADRPPGVPGDLQDHDGDREPDHRVDDRNAEPGGERAADHSERDEAVDSRVLSVCEERRAAEPAAAAEAHLRGDL